MRYARHLLASAAAGLLIGGTQAGAITGGETPAAAPDAFQIMTPAEVAEHQARMAALSGEAREAYRDAQYAKLRERAQAQGFELPETPPWSHSETPPPPATPADIAARQAALQKEVEARREALRQELAARRAAEPPAPPSPPAALICTLGPLCSRMRRR